MLEGEGRDASRTEGFSRRGVLAAALTGGVAAMLPGSGASGMAEAASVSTGATAASLNATQFFSDPSLNFRRCSR